MDDPAVPNEHRVAEKKSFVNPFHDNAQWRTASFMVLFTYSLLWAIFWLFRPAFLFWTYPFIYVSLLIWRVYSYYREDAVLYVLSPCYFVNISLIIFLVALPTNREMELVMFGLVFGPVYVANFVFRSTLAFENPDKFTTCFIHIAPIMITFCTRWYPGQASKYWWTFNQTDFEIEWLKLYALPNIFYLYAIPLMCICGHTLLYNSILHVCVRLPREQMDLTRYIIAEHPFFIRFKSRFSQNCLLLMYTSLFCLYSAATLTLAIIAYMSFIFNVTLLCFSSGWVLWYTSSYYVTYLPKSMATVAVPFPIEVKQCESDDIEGDAGLINNENNSNNERLNGSMIDFNEV